MNNILSLTKHHNNFLMNKFMFSPLKENYLHFHLTPPPVDYAYTIHTDIGDRCAGAIVNGQESPLSTKLNNGDQVEIILDESTTISPLWIRFVKKEKVKEKIRYFFRSKRRREFEILGKDILNYIAKSKNIVADENTFNKILTKTDFKFKNKLFENVGRGFLSRAELDKLFKEMEDNIVKKIFQSNDDEERVDVLKYENGIAINYATCCSPIKGDSIISIMSYGRGLVVHNTICDSLGYYHKDNFYKSEWGEGQSQSEFNSRIEIVIKNQPGACLLYTSPSPRDQ